jgi:hypothetical protein
MLVMGFQTSGKAGKLPGSSLRIRIILIFEFLGFVSDFDIRRPLF